MKFTIFLTVLCLLSLIANVTISYFVEGVPLLAVYQTPLRIISIVTGSIAGIFIVIKIIQELREIFKNGKE